jgi:hypothetical protein
LLQPLAANASGRAASRANFVMESSPCYALQLPQFGMVPAAPAIGGHGGEVA